MLEQRGIATSPRGRTPVALLDALGVLELMGHSALLIHCVRCDASDLATINTHRSQVVLCPHSNAYFGHGTAPHHEMVRAGIVPAIGTDSMASNSAMDLLAEARSALGVEANHTPYPVWLHATVSGTHALSLSDHSGTLNVGKQADIVAFPLPAGTTDTRHIKIGPEALLTVVDGVERVRDGRFVGDAAGIRARNATVAKRLREWRQGVTRA
jgi:cytosine/adenosine deaminase-related metal-dependent hydrolase